MKLPRDWSLVLVASLSLLAAPPLALARPAPAGEETPEEKAEKERKKREDKAAQKEAREQEKDEEVMDEIDEEINNYARRMLTGLYDDAFLQDYVNEMGQRLVAKETPPGVLFSFRVVRDPLPNALALPDGRIYVNTGLLGFVRNEAQLAAVLGHEIGHVTQRHAIRHIRESRSIKRRLLPGLIGGVLGGVIGGIAKGKEGAAAGATLGIAAGAVASVVSLNSYGRKLEDEADTIGVRLALSQGYDARESLAFFEKLRDKYGEEDKFANALWGSHSRNGERIEHIQQLLDGPLADNYNALRGEGRLSAGTGQMHFYTSRMLRELAIDLIDCCDRWILAKEMLESIADYRARDPRTLWALGRVYKMVGRTEADRAKALDYLQKAALYDERNWHPYVLRDLGLMQARMASGPSGVAPAVESLKKYVLHHIDRHELYPADIDQIYDYLLTFGDGKWTAPKVESQIVRAAAPLAPETPPAAPRSAKPPVRALKPTPGTRP